MTEKGMQYTIGLVIRRAIIASFAMLGCALASRAVAALTTPDVNRDGIVNGTDIAIVAAVS